MLEGQARGSEAVHAAPLHRVDVMPSVNLCSAWAEASTASQQAAATMVTMCGHLYLGGSPAAAFELPSCRQAPESRLDDDG